MADCGSLLVCRHTSSNVKYLLSQREDGKGFELTGGTKESGEDSLSTALRETLEEVSLSISPKTCSKIFSARQFNGYDFSVFATVLESNPKLKPQKSEVKSCGFYTLEEIIKMRSIMLSGDEDNGILYPALKAILYYNGGIVNSDVLSDSIEFAGDIYSPYGTHPIEAQ